MKYKILAILIMLLSALQGCFLAPTIDSVRRAGVTPASRRGLLPENIKKFHDALYWGTPTEIMRYVDEKGREVISKQVSDMQDKERVVESKVKNIEFDDDAYEAEVNVNVRSFKVGYYVVTDRIEKQTWAFSLSDGWKIVSREIKVGT